MAYVLTEKFKGDTVTVWGPYSTREECYDVRDSRLKHLKEVSYWVVHMYEWTIEPLSMWRL